MPEDERGPDRLVWARGAASAQECPKSLVTAESVSLVEAFFAWKAGGQQGAGQTSWFELPARVADGLVILDVEWKNEGENGDSNGA